MVIENVKVKFNSKCDMVCAGLVAHVEERGFGCDTLGRPLGSRCR